MASRRARSTTSTRSRTPLHATRATATSSWSCRPAPVAACTRRFSSAFARERALAYNAPPVSEELTLGFADDANALIEKKKFDDLESLWMNQLDSDPSDADAFLKTAKALRKAEQRTLSDTLVGLLSSAPLPAHHPAPPPRGAQGPRPPLEASVAAPPADRAGAARRVRHAPRLPARLRALRLQRGHREPRRARRDDRDV